MALDHRYRWTFPVRDAHGREGTFAVGIDVTPDGRRKVIVNAPSWLTFDDPELAEQAGYCLTSAAYVARDLTGRGSP